MRDATRAWFDDALAHLAARREMPPEDVRRAVVALTDGADDILAAAFLTAWRTEGRPAQELAAAADVLRGRMVRLDPPAGFVVDTCGTGGDGSGTFNISTAVALVVAGAGVPVVKHGNRAASSRVGQRRRADRTRRARRIRAGLARRCLDRFGFAFCYAPHFHPALANVAGVRKKLGFRTAFNLLGPLLNPADAPCQLLGVGRPEWLDPVADALALARPRRAFVVCGEDGFDEVSLAGGRWSARSSATA